MPATNPRSLQLVSVSARLATTVLLMTASVTGLGLLVLGSHRGSIAATASEPGSGEVRIATLAPREVPPTDQDVSGVDSGFRLAIGDKLKLTFFEQLRNERDTTAVTLAPSFVERAELSGVYTVQVNGAISLPFAGSVKVAGLSDTEASKLVVGRTAPFSGGQLVAHLAIVDREPVYVTGGGRKHGSYKYSPGMLVAHAVALASAEAPGGDLWKRIDIARERDRLSKAEERLKRDIAVLDVLSSETAGNIEAAQPSPRLVEIAGVGAREHVASALRARRLELERFASHVGALEALMAAAKVDLQQARERAEQVGSTVVERTKRRDELASRVRGGTSPETLLAQARKDLAEAKGTLFELKTQIVRQETRILDLGREHDVLVVTQRIDLDQRLSAAKAAIIENEATMANISKLLLQVKDVTGDSSAAGVANVTIVRRTSSGLTQIQANDLTALEPGDMVRLAGDQADRSGIVEFTQPR